MRISLLTLFVIGMQLLYAECRGGGRDYIYVPNMSNFGVAPPTSWQCSRCKKTITSGSSHLCVTPSNGSADHRTQSTRSEEVHDWELTGNLDDSRLLFNQSYIDPVVPEAVTSSSPSEEKSSAWIYLLAVLFVVTAFFIYAKTRKTRLNDAAFKRHLNEVSQNDEAKDRDFFLNTGRLTERAVSVIEKGKEKLGDISTEKIKETLQGFDTEDIGTKTVAQITSFIRKTISFTTQVIYLLLLGIFVGCKIVVAIIQAIANNVKRGYSEHKLKP